MPVTPSAPTFTPLIDTPAVIQLRKMPWGTTRLLMFLPTLMLTDWMPPGLVLLPPPSTVRLFRFSPTPRSIAVAEPWPRK